MSASINPDIITDGLVLCLDAANPSSYPGTGTSWNDLSGNNYNFTLYNSPIFNLHKNTSCFTFSGSNDYASRDGAIGYDIGAECTINLVMASANNTNFGACSRLVSANAGDSSPLDYANYFCLAACDQTRFGLWKNSGVGGLYPTSVLKTPNDDYKFLTVTWKTSGHAIVYVNGIQENIQSLNSSTFNYSNIGRITLGTNASLAQENSYIRISSCLIYNKQLTAKQILDNYNATKGRFGL